MNCGLFPDPKPYPHHWAASADIHVQNRAEPSDGVVWVTFSYRVGAEPRYMEFNFCPEAALEMASALIVSAAKVFKDRERLDD